MSIYRRHPSGAWRGSSLCRTPTFYYNLISTYARRTTANTGHMHKASMYTDYKRFMGHKETKGYLGGAMTRHVFYRARFPLNHPKILSLFLCTGVFAVSPVGFRVSAEARCWNWFRRSSTTQLSCSAVDQLVLGLGS